MSRKTVRVEVPVDSPEKMVKLGETAVAEHTDLGETSPLDKAKMNKLSALIAPTKQAQANMADHEAKAQTFRQARDLIWRTTPLSRSKSDCITASAGKCALRVNSPTIPARTGVWL